MGLFEGLMRYDAPSMQPVPAAAEAVSISDDGLRYEFTIRGGAQWSDGTPLTAHDFAWSWRRLQRPEFGAEYAYLLHMVKHAAELNLYAGHADALEGEVATAFAELVAEATASAAASGSGIDAATWGAFVREYTLADRVAGTPDERIARAVAPGASLAAADVAPLAAALAGEATRRRDRNEWAEAHFGVDAGVFAVSDRTLVVELTAPTPYFLSLTAFYPALPVPRWVVEAEGNARDWFLPHKIVSNGPFELESWRVNHKIRLVKSDTYWGRDEVHANRVDILPIEHEATALNLYLTGHVDWLPSVYPLDLSEALRTRDDFYSHAALATYFYKLNTTRPPFDDVRVRRAINLAIDRELITQEVLQLGQLPAVTYVPPGMAGYESPEPTLRHDIEEARRLLAEAGYPNGEGMREIGILYNTNESHKKVAEVVADQLRRHLGVEARAYNQEWQSFLTTVSNLDYDMSRYGWYGDYEDPNTFLDMWLTGGPNNNTGFADAGFDRLVQAAGNLEPFLASGALEAFPWKEPERIRAGVARVEVASDPKARRQALGRLRMDVLREAERILIEDGLPIVPIYFYVASGLIAPEVRGFHTEIVVDGVPGTNLRSIHPLRSIRIDANAARPRLGG